MRIDAKDYRAPEGEKVHLEKWPTKVDPVYKSKHQYKSLLEEHVARLSAMQQLHHASNRHAILLILQATDAAGKDGAIRHVMSGVNPQGCRVYGFKQPTDAELEHDFLWRTTRDLPERGRIAIFNRSYYEEVLVVRVHPDILHREAIPDAPHHDRESMERALSINQLNSKNTSGSMERASSKSFSICRRRSNAGRFLERLDDPEKNWKFSDADLKEREFWNDYAKAYEECLSATSTDDAPWFIVPADDKENCATHCLPNRPRHVRRIENELSENKRGP